MEDIPIVTISPGAIIPEAEYEKLYSVPAEIVTLLSIFYGSISIIAVIGNALVIWVVTTTRNMHTVTNMYIANLAFADVFIGMFCIPFQFQAALLQRWDLPHFMCAFCPFVQLVSVNVSVFTLTAIAIDRHRAIINPLRARPTKFISKIIIGGIWLISFAFAMPCAIAYHVIEMKDTILEDDVIQNVTRPFCDLDLSKDQLQTYRYLLVFFQYLVPFCVISFVYIQMAVKLWGTRAPGNAQDSRDMTLLRNKKKVIKMLIIVVAVFGLCWLPLQTYNILHATIPEVNEYRFINIIFFCCDWLAMSNSCYNPFIYGIYNEKFKREFNNRFAVCFCKFKTTLDSHERTMSMHTRASSIRSTYANSSTRIRNNVNLSQQNQQQQQQQQQQQKKLLRNSSRDDRLALNSLTTNPNGHNNFEVKNPLIPTSLPMPISMPFNTITYFDDNKQLNNFGTMMMIANNCPKLIKTNNKSDEQWKKGQQYNLSFNPNSIVYNNDNNIIKNLNSSTTNDDDDDDDDIIIDENSPIIDEDDDDDDRTSRRCVCENELNERNGCDGSCILNQMAQVRNVDNICPIVNDGQTTLIENQEENDENYLNKKTYWYPTIHVNKMSDHDDNNEDDDNDDDDDDDDDDDIVVITKNVDNDENIVETNLSDYAMLQNDVKFHQNDK